MGRRRSRNKKGNKKVNKSKSNNVNPDTSKANIVKEFKQVNYGKELKLRFSPTAWGKLLFLRDIGSTEVGGFGITLKDDPLYVYDFMLIEQESSAASVDFKDEDVANFAMDMAEAGLEPMEFMRIWIHTHPHMSAAPSATDEETFNRAFGGCDWAVMAIVSKTGDRYCRIQLNNGPVSGVYIKIPIEVDFTSYNFHASSTENWKKQYENKVTKKSFVYSGRGNYPSNYKTLYGHGPHMGWNEWDEDWCEAYNGFSGHGSIADMDIDADDDDVKYVKSTTVSASDGLDIPNNLLEYMTANELITYDDMSAYEQYTLLTELRDRLKNGELSD